MAWWLMATTAVSDKSPTFDEPLHLVAGYSYWKRSDYRLQPENGPLPQRWIALPMAFGKPVAFVSQDDPRWRGAQQWGISQAVLQQLGNDGTALVARARSFVAIFGVALLLLVYAWARRLFGPIGGMLALVAGAFDPTLLAHGALLTSDTAMALAFLAAISLLWSVLHRLTVGRLLGSLLALGALFVTKFSAPLIVFVALVLVIVRLIGRRPLLIELGRRQLSVATRGRQVGVIVGLVILHTAAVWLLIWGTYGFRYSAFAPASKGRFTLSWKRVTARPSAVQSAVALGRKYHLLPEAYLYGLAFVDAHSIARLAFMNGEVYSGSRLSFFPFALAVKTPLGLLALVLLGLVGASFARRRTSPQGQSDAASALYKATSVYDATPLVALFLIYGIFSLRVGLNIGVRHLLPIYPLLYIAAGGSACWALARFRPALVAAGLALLALVASSWAARPDYLAYFNLTIGQANGYKYLVDSSLDWGQDLRGLADWIKKNAPNKRVYLSSFGSLDPRGFGLRAKLLPGHFDFRATPRHSPEVFRLEPGVYCISATMLSGVYLPPLRPWTGQNRRNFLRYQQMLGQALAAQGQPTDRATLRSYLLFDKVRFIRLAAALRKREPDAQVGYSVLIYYVGAEELARAFR